MHIYIYAFQSSYILIISHPIPSVWLYNYIYTYVYTYMMITHDNHQMLDFSTPPKKGRKVVYHYVMLLYLYSSCFLAISIFSEGPPPNFDAFHQVMWPFAQLKWSHFGGKPDFQTPKLIRVKLCQKKKSNQCHAHLQFGQLISRKPLERLSNLLVKRPCWISSFLGGYEWFDMV